MSTHATIAIQLDEGFIAVYLQYDGYPDNCESILQKHWNSKYLATAIMMGGDIRSLGENKMDTFYESGQDDWDIVKPKLFNNIDELKKYCNTHYCNWLYVWELDNAKKWSTIEL